ncbi:MAG: DUF1648 domain-containing protein [Ruminococcaceae bacterium]|nr:DUF1648 domain-containing protein [Oscillospiraceae bacterium]
MLKKNWLKILISSLVTLSPIAFGLAVWNKLPETMSTHWGISGEADGFSSRTFAVFGLPLILLALNFICIVTSFFDKKNRGTKVHNMIYYIIPLISLFTNAIVYSAAFEKTWDFAAIIPLVLGLLFAVMGNLMPKIRQNGTLGIKTKWTLQSEENWNATHRFGGKVMVIAGLLVMLTAFLPVVPMFFTTMAIILIAVFAAMLYSYLYYKKEVKNGKTDFNHICPKFNKVGKIISLIVVPIIIIGICIVMFTGSISITYTDDSFTVDSTYYDPLTINYSDIEEIKVKENDQIGVKEFAFNSAKLSLGKFINDEFGSHTRYTYNACKTVVVMKIDGKILVINDKNDDVTREIYLKILGKIQSNSGFITGEGEEI